MIFQLEHSFAYHWALSILLTLVNKRPPFLPVYSSLHYPYRLMDSSFFY